MAVGGLFEVVLYVQDMQKQVEFYRDVLGLSVKFPQTADYSNEFWVEFAAGGCTLALHAGGQKRIGEDALMLVFQVENIELIRDELINKGVAMTEVREPAPDHFSSTGHDPEGNTFSIESRVPAEISD